MKPPITHKIQDQTFWLHAHRAIFWEEEKALILSDLHFGKTGHFRKAGIPVPQQVYKEDLQRLVELIQYFNPDQIIAVGDLFHSHANLELELFKRWRLDFAQVTFHLVRGNHDILHRCLYEEMELTLWAEKLQIGNFVFSHEQCNASSTLFSFSTLR